AAAPSRLGRDEPVACRAVAPSELVRADHGGRVRAEDLVKGVVRIWSVGGNGANDKIVGTGFLVAPDLVLTCAHVAARAWGVGHGGAGGLGRPVRLDFAASAPLVVHRATVVRWLSRYPAPGGAYDLAGLMLERKAPSGARPLP